MDAPRKLVVGVWKDKLTPTRAEQCALALAGEFRQSDGRSCVIGVAPPIISMLSVRDALCGSAVTILSQDVHWPAESGSFIGTTSIEMLVDADIRYSMVGHSERRRFFCERDSDVRQKAVGCIEANIVPIICLGDDDQDERARRETLLKQIAGGLAHSVITENPTKWIVAYEPVWAISTWRDDRALPTGLEVAEMLALVRELLAQELGSPVSKVPVLFGGSVGPTNAEDYFGQSGVDGALVGGASLDPLSLASVFTAARNVWT